MNKNPFDYEHDQPAWLGPEVWLPPENSTCGKRWDYIPVGDTTYLFYVV
jgi:hypothetical protein